MHICTQAISESLISSDECEDEQWLGELESIARNL